jgi:uncharacterized integral membrane protein
LKHLNTHTVFRRWLYFLAAALFSVLTITICIYLGSFSARAIAMLIPGCAFAVALANARENDDLSQVLFFIALITLLFAVAGSMAIFMRLAFVGVVLEIPLIVKLLGLAIIGGFFGIMTGAGYGHFIERYHPPIIELAIFGAAGFIIPFLLLDLSGSFFNISFGWYKAGAMIMGWQLLVGYSFSKDTHEDVAEESYWTRLIKKIGK